MARARQLRWVQLANLMTEAPTARPGLRHHVVRPVTECRIEPRSKSGLVGERWVHLERPRILAQVAVKILRGNVSPLLCHMAKQRRERTTDGPCSIAGAQTLYARMARYFDVPRAIQFKGAR